MARQSRGDGDDCIISRTQPVGIGVYVDGVRFYRVDTHTLITVRPELGGKGRANISPGTFAVNCGQGHKLY